MVRCWIPISNPNENFGRMWRVVHVVSAETGHKIEVEASPRGTFLIVPLAIVDQVKVALALELHYPLGSA